MTGLGLYSQALAQCGDLSRALKAAQQAEGRARPLGGVGHVNAQLFLADILRQQSQRDACLQALRGALAAARREGRHDALPELPEMMSRLCTQALEAGIEIDYVVTLIRRHGLAPYKPHVEHWPWPVRIHTLGGFSVVCEDEPLAFAGKSPRKALELLQALISQGGKEVHTSLLAQTVWPDEASSNVRNLFDNTLHRLRRILGPTNILHLTNGKLTLDQGQCWVDAWAFDHLTAACLAGCEEGRRPMDASSEVQAQTALRLYQGHFLERDVEEPWSLPYRDRLRNRFQRLVRVLGARLEATEQWTAAAEVYERGIEIDNLAETFYQHLMICHQKLGEQSESLRVYRRCRELLSIVLGVAPSPATEKIRKESVYGDL